MISPTNQKNWRDVLHVMYIGDTESGWYARGDTTNPETISHHPLAEKLGIDFYELQRHVRFLQNMGLVKEGDEWKLETKGIDVASQNEKIKSDQMIQQVILYFMAASVTVAIVSVAMPFWW